MQITTTQLASGKYLINADEIKLQDKLGGGAFGEVECTLMSSVFKDDDTIRFTKQLGEQLLLQ